jgi:16S rRNA G966 N2-methylase RsmD
MKVKISEIKISNRKRHADPQKVKELADSIKRLGLLNAITISPKKELVAGLHRLEAHKLLGIPRIEARIMDFSDFKRELAEIDENLVRNELSILEQGESILQRDEILSAMNLRAKPHRNKKGAPTASLKTNDSIAAEIGIATRTLQERRQLARDIIPEVKEKLRGTRYAYNSHGLIQLSREPKHIQKAAVKIILKKSTNKTSNESNVIKTAIYESHREYLNVKHHRTGKNYRIPESVKIYQGDFRKVCAKEIADNSIDLVFTDPLYSKEALPLYKDLAEIANRVLKPSGFIISYAGSMYLPEILNYFTSAGLLYHWTGGIKHSTMINKEWNRKVWNCLRLYVVFQKPPRGGKSKFFMDCIESEGREKGHHEFQQNLNVVKYLITKFSEVGDTVLDTCSGSGTSVLACIEEKRKCIAIEQDKKAVQIIKSRITEIMK